MANQGHVGRAGSDVGLPARDAELLALDVELPDGIGGHIHRFQKRAQFVSFLRGNRRFMRRQRCGELDSQLPIFAATVH
jgi:hypothetical protein